MSVATVMKNRRILVIDDSQSIHEDFRKSITFGRDQDASALEDTATRLFGDAGQRIEPADSFEIESAYQGQEALERVQHAVDRHQPFALAFVDVRMPPGWDGIETIERLWKVDPDLQVVICTAYSDVTVDQIISRLGKSDRLLILKKPFDPMEARVLATALTEKWNATRQVRQHILGLQEWLVDAEHVLDILRESHVALESAHLDVENQVTALAELIRQRAVEAVVARDTALLALAKLAETRDPKTSEHLQRMQAYSQVLAETLARGGPYADLVDGPFLEDLHRSSPLHDIGKVGISDAILLKPGTLAPDEFEVMKMHTVIGSDALRRAAEQSDYGRVLQMAADIARHHHERFDGTGYPDGLQGEQIPLAARIAALADEFDVLTAGRAPNEALIAEDAGRLIAEQRGRHFDPVMVDAFHDCFEEFVRIRSG